MKRWSSRTWGTEGGAEIRVESDTAEDCRRLFRARVKHLHQWTETAQAEKETEEARA